MMKMKTFIFALSVVFFSQTTWGNPIEHRLMNNIWKMERNTGMGKVKTVWIFLAEGKGIAYQSINRNNNVTMKQHSFTYKLNNARVIVQEEIEKEWEGHFGVTRWTFTGDRLLGDVKFRQEVIAFTPL